MTHIHNFKEAVKNIVEAESVVSKRRAISKLSLMFYTFCRQEGLDREDIIPLTTQILDCFITDLEYLMDKIDK
jgi:hypothetical protein